MRLRLQSDVAKVFTQFLAFSLALAYKKFNIDSWMHPRFCAYHSMPIPTPAALIHSINKVFLAKMANHYYLKTAIQHKTQTSFSFATSCEISFSFQSFVSFSRHSSALHTYIHYCSRIP